MIAGWSPAELDIVETLARRVKLLSTGQLLDAFSSAFDTSESLRVALRRLLGGSLLHSAIVNAHPRLQVTAPLAVWKPSDQRPDSAQLARRVKARWTRASVPTRVYCASSKSANLFGGSAIRSPSISQRDHDLLLAEVYIFYRAHRKSIVHRWTGEQAVPKPGPGIKTADAILCSDEGKPILAIESAGRCTGEQLESFHEHCAENDLPYELW